jgi:hypothetical protein
MENKVCRFYGDLRREIQDIVYYKDFNTTKPVISASYACRKKNCRDINKRTKQTLVTTSTRF